MDKQTSLLVQRQVPGFVREDNPLFVQFLKAYYQFLEQPTNEYKTLKYISDVDVSIEDYKNNYLNTFAQLLPKEYKVDDAFLIKNVLPLYLSKGSERSYRFLFRLLFDEEITIKYFRDNILYTSASKWVTQNSLNVVGALTSKYTGDGTNTEFYLTQFVTKSDIQVYVNDVLITTGYDVNKTYRQLVFDTAPTANSSIKVKHKIVDNEIFTSRKIVGLTSGASCIIEKSSFVLTNNRETLRLFVNGKTLNGTFTTGEKLQTNVFINDTLVDVELVSISEFRAIKVTNGGANYNVGDPALIVSPNATRNPAAIVSKVFVPKLDAINIIDGGCGFTSGSNIKVNGVDFPLTSVKVGSVIGEPYTANTANSFVIFKDVISDVDPANTLLSATSYGLSFSSGNLSSNILSCLTQIEYVDIGEIVSVDVSYINIPIDESIVFKTTPAKIQIANVGYTKTNTTVFIDTFGSLGKIKIVNPGFDYELGEEVVFVKKPMCLGIGAEAIVTEIGPAGQVLNIDFVPAKIAGTANVNVSISATQVNGLGTSFLTDLRPGNKILLNGESKVIANIDSDTTLNVSTSFSQTFENKVIRLYEKYAIGGQGYTSDKIPDAYINSPGGSGAVISVTALMGTGDNIKPAFKNNGKKLGEIEEFQILDAGEGVLVTPTIDMSRYGSGNATAQAILYSTFDSYGGSWISTDSHLSSFDRKLQGLNYYVNQSYLISSPVEYKKYKKVIKELLHPAGYVNYAQYTTKNEIEVGNCYTYVSVVGGKLWGVGLSSYTEGLHTAKSSPIQMFYASSNWKQISAAGNNFRAAIKTDGTLWLWGDNIYGIFGNNTNGDGTYGANTKSSPVQTVAGGTNWKQVECGHEHVGAIKNDGTLWLWGRNQFGQLGTNNVISRSSPVQTVSGGTNWKQVSCGYNFTAAIKTDGTLWTWGYNPYTLGDGTTNLKSSPIQTASGGTNWSQVSCGQYHTAAIKTDGTLWVWGYNDHGYLGTNDTIVYSIPVQTVANSSNWSQVSCGYDYTAAVKTDGTLWMWGRNTNGKLGDNTVVKKSSPVQTVGGGTNWKQVSCGPYDHTAAIKTDGTLWTWGYNAFGDLGTNDTTNRSSPVQTVVGDTNWTDVSVGASETYAIESINESFYTCKLAIETANVTAAILSTYSIIPSVSTVNESGSVIYTVSTTGIPDGTVLYWTNSGNTSPIDFSDSIDSGSVTIISNSGTITRTLSPDATTEGNETIILQLRKLSTVGPIVATASTVTVTDTSLNPTYSITPNVSSISETGTVAFTVTTTDVSDGTILYWTDSGNTSASDFTDSSNSGSITIISGSNTISRTLVADLTTEGNETIKLELRIESNTGPIVANAITVTVNDTSLDPVPTYSIIPDVSSVDEGNTVTYTITTTYVANNETLYWTNSGNTSAADFSDSNNEGSVTITSNTGTIIRTLSSDVATEGIETVILELRTGSNTGTIVATANTVIVNDTSVAPPANTLFTWGDNAFGQLGDNTISNKSSPVQTISAGTDWKQVSSGVSHAAAVKTDGTLWSWGYNLYGQIGDDTITDKSSPVQTIAGGNTWTQVSTSGSHTAAVKTDGTLWTWGYNAYGQLGTNSLTPQSSPVQTVAGGTNWQSVATGGSDSGFTAAIKTDGSLWFWGYNVDGAFGTGNNTGRSSPVIGFGTGKTWKSVSCGLYFASAINTDGTLWSSGNNDGGQLGNNSTLRVFSPVQTISGGSDWSQVSCGGAFIAAIKTDGTLWSWGDNTYGNLGTNDRTSRSSPIQTVSAGTNWKYVDCGDSHTGAIKTDGTLWTWGRNIYGQLGDNSTANKSSPVQTIAGGTNWVSIDMGGYFSAGIRSQ